MNDRTITFSEIFIDISSVNLTDSVKSVKLTEALGDRDDDMHAEFDNRGKFLPPKESKFGTDMKIQNHVEAAGYLLAG